MAGSVKLNKVLCCLSVLMFTLSFACVQIFGENMSMINIIQTMDAGLDNSTNWLSSKPINNCIIYEYRDGKRTGNSIKPTLTANVSTYCSYDTGLIHIQTQGYDITQLSSELLYSNCVILKFYPLNASNTLLDYVYNVGIYTSANYPTVDAYCVMRSLGAIYVLYSLRSGENISALQFNIEMYFQQSLFNQGVGSRAFGFSNLLVYCGSSEYVSYLDYNLIYLMQKLILLYNNNVDIASIETDLTTLCNLLDNIDDNVDLIVDMCQDISNKCDTIINHLVKIENGLYDATDNISWLSKIFESISGSSSIDTSKIDDSKSKLDNLDNAIDTSKITENISSFDDIKAPNVVSFGNKWLFWQQQIDNTFDCMSGTLVDSDGFKILWTIPLLLLVIGLVL